MVRALRWHKTMIIRHDEAFTAKLDLIRRDGETKADVLRRLVAEASVTARLREATKGESK